MNKFVILAAVAVLGLTACDKMGGSGGAHSQFVKMCQEDPRAKQQGFNCECQADIISAVLKKEEMDKLVNFLNVEKQDANKAMELGKDPSYTPMFQKISGIGLAIHDKCGNPNAPAPAAAPAAAAPAPAATAPAPAAAAPVPAKPKPVVRAPAAPAPVEEKAPAQ